MTLVEGKSSLVEDYMRQSTHGVDGKLLCKLHYEGGERVIYFSVGHKNNTRVSLLCPDGHRASVSLLGCYFFVAR